MYFFYVENKSTDHLNVLMVITCVRGKVANMYTSSVVFKQVGLYLKLL